MQRLLQFLLKYNYVLLFLLLEVGCMVMMFRFNHYQQSQFFTSTNKVVGKIYEAAGELSAYFYLRSMNDDLLDRNIVLEQKVYDLERQLQTLLDTCELHSTQKVSDDFNMYKAHVIKNSIHLSDNYITLDKGADDGIKPDMGVVDRNGIVGIVYKTSPSFSLVISVLNSKSNISCRIDRSEYFGYLQWEYNDSKYAYLRDLPRHAQLIVGDTVVTSGYSAVFPEGVVVGTVDEIEDSNDGLTYKLKIKLSTDFGKLGDVRIIERKSQQERRGLEQLTKKK